MTPEEFIATWKNNPLTERAGAQAHFDDLCDLLGVSKPRDPDNYCFERGAKKSGGDDGWADVWKRGFFGWENKRPGKDLSEALKQLLDYSLNLDNPPLLVVSDRERIIIHTTFPGYPDEPREIRIDDLNDPQQREMLRWIFTDPEKLKPGKSFKAITEEAAARFAALAEKMRQRGDSIGFDAAQPTPRVDHSQRVAHFLVQCLFCLFAEDERLLPENLFADLLKNAGGDVDKARKRLGTLFTAMRNPSGEYGDHDIAWFNGGLFKIIDIPPLEANDLAELHAAARDLDWRDIDPTIFGTLFERGLDPKTRAPLGAHYTDVETILKLIDPVVTQPLLREWNAAKIIIQAGVGKGEKTKAYKAGQQAYQGFLLRLYEFRVLDAACGSGNFLYLALKALRDLEKRVRVEARDLGLQDPQVMLQTGPHNILGLEINDYAAELARVTVWIGDIQWCRRNGYPHATDPILQSLDGIEHRDALLAFPPLPEEQALNVPRAESRGEAKWPAVSEAEWPQADVIVGNPPFLGDKMMRRELGDAYVDTLRKTYAGRVPGGADLVCYWFEKARAHIAAGHCQAAGLVATNSIRGGANRKVLERILSSTLAPDPPGEMHGDGNLRYLESGAEQRSGRTGDESLSGQRPRADQNRSGHTQMDDGHPAGRGDLAGDEKFLLTPAPVSRSTPLAGTGAERLRIFNAWSDEPWINEGAAVRVSLVCFGEAGRSAAPSAKPGVSPAATRAHPDGFDQSPEGPGSHGAMLNGQPVAVIHADLTAGGLNELALDLTQARKLPKNVGISFQGPVLIGAFDVSIEQVRSWLTMPNPNGRPNSEVLRPLTNGKDITSRSRSLCVIDFGMMPETEACLFELPFDYVRQHVKPLREKNPRINRREKWWIHGETGAGWRRVTEGISRYLATSQVSKHRFFVWLDTKIWPHQTVISIARADDTTFGILHSRFHELWSLRMGTSLEDRPRYTPTTTFETFPFPAGLTPADTRPVAQPCFDSAQHESGRPAEANPAGPATPVLPVLADPSRLPAAEAIATAAFELNRLREAWLNPPEWVDWVITPEEEHAGFPRRPVAKPGHEADLKKRTLTNLYNARPAWLSMAHEALDRAVAAAYGWDDYTPDMPEEEILKRLLALNRERAARP